jgi:hypothetical protein
LVPNEKLNFISGKQKYAFFSFFFMEFPFFIIIFRCFIQPQTVTANVEDFGIGLQLTEKDGLFVVDYLSPYSPFNFKFQEGWILFLKKIF